MKSIRTKMTAITVIAILTSIMSVFAACYSSIQGENDRGSVNMMNLLGQDTRKSLEKYFESIEQSVEELYGDTWTREDKDAEIARLKAEQGIIDMDEPAVNLDGVGLEDGTPAEGLAAEGQKGGRDGDSGDRKEDVSDDGKAGKGSPGSGQ